MFQLPLVFTHADLNGLNVLTDADGHITGVIDWDESAWKPFGVGLYGLDMFLGSRGPEGYSRVDGYDNLRAQFFETLWSSMPLEIISKQRGLEKAIQLAEMVGVLYRCLEWRADGTTMSRIELTALEARLRM